MRRISILVITSLLAAFTMTAKVGPVDVVQSYNSNLGLFLEDGDVEYLDVIDNLLRGGDVKCVINNSLAKEFAREKRWDAMTMHSDTYHNELINRRENGEISSVSLTEMKWLKDWVEPRIKISNKDIPVQFVSATTNVTGAESGSYNDLFFVRGNHIVKIEDFSDSENIGQAIKLYNAKDYDSAFKIFRKLAYESRDARQAQYYYVVMLIRGQGCGTMAKKVRDLEAAWFGLAGFKAGYGDLKNLAEKFSMSVVGYNFEQIWIHRPSYNGRRIVKKDNKFGILDDSGKMVVDYRNGYPGQFSCDGLTQISVDGTRWGLIDSDGNQVIPYEYDKISPYLVNDKLMAIKDGKLYILSKTGVPLRIIEGKFTSIPFVLFGGLALVGSENNTELYDFDGNLVDDTFDELSLNYTNSRLSLRKKGADAPYATYLIKW